MEQHRAIPQGFMTVGQLAKKMNTTVRTLQYYDKEGLLSPSAESEGGRRLYTDKDIVRLHQIQSLKYLGFSLHDIKYRLVSLDTPEEVADVLADQARTVRENMAALSEVLETIEKLQVEILQMKSVDFKKYADIVVNLQMKNDFYWVIKHFDEKILDHIRERFDPESGREVLETFQALGKKAYELKQAGIAPDSEAALELAKAWWDMVMEFTDGDMSLVPELQKFAESNVEWKAEFDVSQEVWQEFIPKALEAYFTKLGKNPFEEISQ
jgi:DNA-binding transcriptional MerR regulator